MRPAPITTDVSGSSAICTGSSRVFAQALVEIAEQRAAAGDHDAAVVDVGRQFGRDALERVADGVDHHVDVPRSASRISPSRHVTLFGNALGM